MGWADEEFRGIEFRGQYI